MKFLLFSLFLASCSLYAQQENEGGTGPLTKTAFDKNIMRDINFMVLGENNLKQGFSYEYKEKNSELSFNANMANLRSCIITADGEFSVEDGVYVFDEKDGSKKAKVTVNFFIPIVCLNAKKFTSYFSTEAGATNRARINNMAAIRSKRTKIHDDLIDLHVILSLFKLPTSELSMEPQSFYNAWGFLNPRKDRKELANLISEFNGDVGKAITTREKEIIKKLLSYLESPTGFEKTETLSAMEFQLEGGARKFFTLNGDGYAHTYSVPELINIEKLLKDYDAAFLAAQNIDSELADIQIKNFDNVWTVHKTAYLGLSPYYERQGLDIYNYKENTGFTDLFSETRGDLFGSTLTFNYLRSYKSGGFIMFRALGTWGRGSNLSEFKKKEYSYTTMGDSINGIPVHIENKKTGYTHESDLAYDYGFVQKYNAELYLSLKSLGIYAKIGYEKNGALQKKELYPFETGFMINLKSDKKNIVSVLLFASRKNLNLHPDDDMNIGFKIGLPIFIRQPLPDNEVAAPAAAKG